MNYSETCKNKISIESKQEFKQLSELELSCLDKITGGGFPAETIEFSPVTVKVVATNNTDLYLSL